MLKITAIGNLTNDVELKCHEDGKPYAILSPRKVDEAVGAASEDGCASEAA